jgi:hypothetical protein
MKVKRILFSQSFFGTDAAGNHRALFEAGKDYPEDDEEAKRCVARGIAEMVEVEVADPEPPVEPPVEPPAPASVAAQDAANAAASAGAAPASAADAAAAADKQAAAPAASPKKK